LHKLFELFLLLAMLSLSKQPKRAKVRFEAVFAEGNDGERCESWERKKGICKPGEVVLLSGCCVALLYVQ
jgi:hypothetical protein